MRNFIIVSMIAFGLVACEDTTTQQLKLKVKRQQQLSLVLMMITIQLLPHQLLMKQRLLHLQQRKKVVQVRPLKLKVWRRTTKPTRFLLRLRRRPPNRGQILQTLRGREEELSKWTPLKMRVTLEDLTAEDLADIDILRDNIFSGLDVGKELYLSQVNLALEDLGINSGYQILDDEQELPEVSDCPYVEFYNNQVTATGLGCEYLVDKARSDAYSKLYGTLVANREGYDPDLSEQDFWFEQGAVSGLEEARVLVRVDLKVKQLCNQEPNPVKSSEEKGLVVGRQHFINSMNNWLTTNGIRIRLSCYVRPNRGLPS
jgi:hypothetical protein